MSARAQARIGRRLRVSRYFGCPAILVRITGDFNDRGEYEETETETVIKCATAPATGDDARVRVLTEGGVRLDGMRRFWLTEAVEPVGDDTAGDVIEYDGERFRAHVVERWGPEAFEVLAVRQEGQ